MVNADGPQELFVFALTRKGRVETTNYRTVKLPTDMDLPLYVKDEFAPFYKAMFAEQVRPRGHARRVPRVRVGHELVRPVRGGSALARRAAEARRLLAGRRPSPGPMPLGQRPRPMPPVRGGAVETFVTRLHVRYDAAHFPEDLVFQETGDRSNFQGRYVLRHAWSGSDRCEAATDYLSSLPARYEKDAQSLATLTGWKIADIRRKMNVAPVAANPPVEKGWWERLWRTGEQRPR